MTRAEKNNKLNELSNKMILVAEKSNKNISTMYPSEWYELKEEYDNLKWYTKTIEDLQSEQRIKNRKDSTEVSQEEKRAIKEANITCLTYERAINRINRDINNRFNIK